MTGNLGNIAGPIDTELLFIFESFSERFRIQSQLKKTLSGSESHITQRSL